LQKISIPTGCIFNTFGFGCDHDSKLLHAIALKTQGVYYYIPSQNDINGIFGECIHSILSARACKVRINLSAQDGSRIITLATPFQITQQTVSKEYNIDLGLMHSGEQKKYFI